MKSLEEGLSLNQNSLVTLIRVPMSLRIGYLFRVIHFLGEVEGGWR